MANIEPWLAEIPSDIDEKSPEYQQLHHIYAFRYETETGRCITWPELIKLIHSNESYRYQYSVPVTRECFLEDLGNWEPEAGDICSKGYHSIDVVSWDIDSISREVTKLMIGFCAQEGDGPDSDGFGRSMGSFFASWIDRSGHQITPFQIVTR